MKLPHKITRKPLRTKKLRPEVLQMRAYLAKLAEDMEKLAAGELEGQPDESPVTGVPAEDAALLARVAGARLAVARSLGLLRQTAADTEVRFRAGNFAENAGADCGPGCYAELAGSFSRLTAAVSGPVHELTEAAAGQPTPEQSVCHGDFAAACAGVRQCQDVNRQELEKRRAFVERLDQKAEEMTTLAKTLEQAAGEGDKQSQAAAAVAKSISVSMTQSAATLSDSSSHITGIASSIEEMSATVRNLAAASEQMSASTREVSQLVGDIHGNLKEVSDSSSRISKRVDSTVLSIKEISQSLDNVGGQCQKSLQIAGQAGETAAHTNAIIEKLSESSRQIGKVISLINDIASQTNILALNAAIEAASAGDAGRGFAVVANEVKELARQTADATGDIREQIDTMQKNMTDAVQAVSDINEVIRSIIGISGSINTAVTRQMTSASQISDSATQAAGDLAQAIGQIATVTKETEDVSHSTEETAKGVEDIARSTAELSAAAQEAAKNSETASASLNEVDTAMSAMLKAILTDTDQMHGTEETVKKQVNGSHELHRLAEEIAEFSRGMEQGAKPAQAHG